MSQKLWKKCLDKFRYDLSEYEFNTWILPLQVVIYDRYIDIFAHNIFIFNYVYKNYLNKINNYINHLIKKKLMINFYIGNKFLIESVSKKNIYFNKNKFNDCNLNRNYKFNNFFISETNLFAYKESIKISYLNSKYNNNKLLLIYGDYGLGKTHLLNSIGNNVLYLYGLNKNVIYINSENFVSKMVWSLYNNFIDSFRSYFFNADILLMDDIQFLVNKKRSQKEFLYILNYLLKKNCFIVFTFNNYIKNINLNKKLIFKLLSGLMVKLNKIDLKIKFNFINFELKNINLKLNKNIINYICNLNINNIYEIKGLLNNLFNYSIYYKCKNNITLDFVIYIIYNFTCLCKNKNRILNIQKLVCNYYNISISDLLSKFRYKFLVYPRHMSIAISKKLTNFSLIKLGNFFGGLNHSSILYSCKKIEKLCIINNNVKLDFNNLVKIVLLSENEILYKKKKNI